ncbi:MAG: DUF1992 domain-containing protein [Planctomycetaceae bacterium]|nr:DUF1992 domain-containing protein [Planctomycetaceae bacterium]
MSKSDGPEITEKAWQLLTECKIQAAEEEGLFLDLPGFGKPLKSIDEEVEAELQELRSKRQPNGTPNGSVPNCN